MAESERRPMGERVAALETMVILHIKSCDKKGTVVIALLSVVLAATLSAFGILLRAQLHLGG